MYTSDQSENCYFEIEKNYLNGYLEVAEELADQLVKSLPQDPRLRLLRGHIYYSLGELKKARYEYELTRGLTIDEEIIDQSLNGLERCDSIQQNKTELQSDATIIFPSHAVLAASQLEQSLLTHKNDQLSPDAQMLTQHSDNAEPCIPPSISQDVLHSIQVVSDDEIPEHLHVLQADEFLPPVNHWFQIAGIILVLGFVGTAILSSILKYQVVVKAPAVIRPIGETRLVQAAVEGKVRQIIARSNQEVKQGDPIVLLDDSRQLTRNAQLVESIAKNRQKLQQIQSQKLAVEEEMLAESNKAARGVDINQAELQTAEASLALAAEEYSRFQALASAGAIADLIVQEKLASYRIAQANLNRAQEMTAQTQEQGLATQARLRQMQDQLAQQEFDVLQQIKVEQKELQQMNIDLANTIIRAPIAGIIQSMNLRNPDQMVGVGQEIARISPTQSGLVIKALVPSQDILPVAVGQRVQLRIAACPYPDFGTLEARVQAIAPDAGSLGNSISQVGAATASSESTSSQAFEVTIKPQEKPLTDGQRICKIRPGMEAQADIITNEETVLKFMLRKARLLWQS
ncbi:HlyD family efflux transporter periplasmic adaptor subunit [Synechococcus elongatus IITB4]|uniref:HlyD family secretion protein n=1 Tax=Synechococcus elongatus TaxID=32046 RepID=UPI0030CC0666